MVKKIENIVSTMAGRILMVAGIKDASIQAMTEIKNIIKGKLAEILIPVTAFCVYVGERHLIPEILTLFFSEVITTNDVLILDNLPLERQLELYRGRKDVLLIEPSVFVHLINDIISDEYNDITYDINFVTAIQNHVQIYLIQMLENCISLNRESRLTVKCVMMAHSVSHLLSDNPTIVRNPVDFSADITRIMNEVSEGELQISQKSIEYLNSLLCNLIYFLVTKSNLLIALGKHGRNTIDSDLIIETINTNFKGELKGHLKANVIKVVKRIKDQIRVNLPNISDIYSSMNGIQVSSQKVFKRMKVSSGNFSITNRAAVAVAAACDYILAEVFDMILKKYENIRVVRPENIELVISDDDDFIHLIKPIGFMPFGTEMVGEKILMSINKISSRIRDTRNYEHQSEVVQFHPNITNGLLNPSTTFRVPPFQDEKDPNQFSIVNYVFDEPNLRGVSDTPPPRLPGPVPTYISQKVNDMLGKITYVE